MKVIELSLKEVKLIEGRSFRDERGFFRETYRQPLYRDLGIPDFVQDNLSYSKQGTLRGMHFQKFPGQAKLVSVLAGDIFDVAVDIRPDSPTFGKWTGALLRAEEVKQLFVPNGFAHGFLVLSEYAYVSYKVSSLFDPEQEKSFRYDDPEIGIKWPAEIALISQKDEQAPYFREVVCV